MFILNLYLNLDLQTSQFNINNYLKYEKKQAGVRGFSVCKRLQRDCEMIQRKSKH